MPALFNTAVGMASVIPLPHTRARTHARMHARAHTHRKGASGVTHIHKLLRELKPDHANVESLCFDDMVELLIL